VQGQFSVLREIFSAPSPLLALLDVSQRLVIHTEDLEVLSEKSKALASRFIKEPCNSLDLLRGLVELVDTQAETHASLMLNHLVQKEPELLCIGLCSIQV